MIFEKNKIFVVILASGSGSRLWALSRHAASGMLQAIK